MRSFEDTFLERFQVGQAFHYATLLRYRDDGRSRSLREWFHHYNARQIIEAGNKEMKGTFFVQHLTPAPTAGAV